MAIYSIVPQMGILDLVFPKTCLGCGIAAQYLCQKCRSKAHTLPDACPYCERASIDGFTHSGCKRVFGLDGLTSVFRYEGIIKKAILALKFKYATEVGRELVDWLVNSLLSSKSLLPNDYCLVPVPTFKLRENVRGFNQSVLIGEGLAKEFGFKFIPDLLAKNKPTVPQSTLSVEDRKVNLRGVFSVNSNHLVPSAYSLILFDDVFTTGSTLHEAAKTLKRSGAKKVWGLTIAR